VKAFILYFRISTINITPRFMSSSYSSISLHLGYATDRSQHTRGQTDTQRHYNHNGHFCRLLYQVVVESGDYHPW